jgi:hypothetical protein
MNLAVRSPSSGWLVSIVLPLLLALIGQAHPCLPQTTRSPAVLEPVDVSMVALIAVPERYDGKLVRTHGFLCIEFEGNALYLHQEDYRRGLTKNSFWLRLSKPQREQFKNLSLKYVVIEGTVYGKGPEQRDSWSGAIGNVTRLEAWPIDRGPVPH